MTRFPEGPAASPGFLLWHLTLAWQRAVAGALAPLELTHVQFVLLASVWWLSEHGHAPNQLQLARHAGTDVKMTSQVLRRLEAKGLLEREIDAADTRARRVRPTPAGIELARRAVATVEQVDAEFFEAEAETMTPLLRRLVAALDTSGEISPGRGPDRQTPDVDHPDLSSDLLPYPEAAGPAAPRRGDGRSDSPRLPAGSTFWRPSQRGQGA